MKTQTRAWLLALTIMGGAGTVAAQDQAYRCQLPDGSVSFQGKPCSLPELVAPQPMPAAQSNGELVYVSSIRRPRLVIERSSHEAAQRLFWHGPIR